MYFVSPALGAGFMHTTEGWLLFVVSLTVLAGMTWLVSLIERLFRRLKGFRRIFSRFEKLDVMFIGFINFSLIVEALRSVNTP